MKVLYLVTLVYLSTAFSSLLPNSQIVLDDSSSHLESAADGWVTTTQEDGILYELFRHPQFAEHRLRITESSLCDSSVKQYSGYLDVADGKHLFFWFFESRNSPQDAPLLLWLNGGPGCTSTAGLLFEHGPCSIADEGNMTTHNPYSWNTHANVIFLDQPVNVGFSYVEDGSKVDTSQLAGKDVYAFLVLFLRRFPEYSKLPFHIAGESYGGTYAPNIARLIYEENQLTSNQLVKINLQSIILGNGLTDAYTQFASVPDYLCEGPYPIYHPKGKKCAILRSMVPVCQRLIKACRKYQSRLVCSPATSYCHTVFFGAMVATGLNPYDARLLCDPKKRGQSCYRELSWIETYMNKPDVKAALGVAPHRVYKTCNVDVYKAFMLQGDSAHNTPALLPELVNNGVRLLVYAGNTDMTCNYMGEERWLEILQTKFLDEFLDAPTEIWTTVHSRKVAGTVRSAGSNGSRAGNVTFVTVYNAGHMVPHDQPEAALDLITRWIFDVPLTSRMSL
ncbi:hypothetical protein ID866_9191 [Astraeus odoratus]|nr:hypothetical protein ID866_9191 [Astraeus odoratus]